MNEQLRHVAGNDLKITYLFKILLLFFSDAYMQNIFVEKCFFCGQR